MREHFSNRGEQKLERRSERAVSEQPLLLATDDKRLVLMLRYHMMTRLWSLEGQTQASLSETMS